MLEITDLIKFIIYTLLRTLTQWLPISSDGHIIILEDLLPLHLTTEFWNSALIAIELAGILAVFLLFMPLLNPISAKKTVDHQRNTGILWLKIIFASIPGIIIYAGFHHFMYERFYHGLFIASILLLIGIALNWIDNRHIGRHARNITSFSEMSFARAFKIGTFQAFTVIPGISGLAMIIIAGRLQGVTRSLIAQFYFLISIPTLFFLNLLNIFNLSFTLSLEEWLYLSLIFAVAFISSIIIIHFFNKYIIKGNYSSFGIYNILNAAILVLYFLFI